jgi:predicted amidohydrolase
LRTARIGLAQISSKIGNVKENTRRHLAVMKKAAAGKVDLTCFPELSLSGYSLKDLAYEMAGDCERELGAVARMTVHGRRAVCGYVKQDALGLVHNSAAVMGDGKVVGSTSKFFLPTYGLFEELRYFVPGNPKTDLKVFGSEKCKFGVIICEDAWHPEPIQALARLGAEVVFCLASSPARGIGKSDPVGELPIESQWLSLLRAQALMNNVFIVFVNRAGPEDEEFFWGGSSVVSPTGEMLARAKEDETDWVTVDIDLDEVKRARRFSSFRDYRAEFHEVLRDL